MEWFQENWVAVGFAATGLAYLLTAIASFTPNKSDDKVAQFVWDLLNKIGWNRGTAANDPSIK